MTDPTGHYELGGVVLALADGEEGLELRSPGVPDGFHPLLEPVRGAHIVRGGPFDGVEAHLDGSALRIGPLTLPRVDPPDPADSGTGQLAPDLAPTSEEEASYARLLEEILALREGEEIEYRLAYPKHRFVQYVTACHAVMFHGSSSHDIDTFQPRTVSDEPHATTGQLPQAAVYGTQEGLWSLFFATLDRSRLRGSICSGVDYFDDRAGRQLAAYHFSIGRRDAGRSVLREGTLYFLPRDSFRRLAFWPGGPLSNEWASDEPIRPLARMRVDPDDFPFQVGTHDDDQAVSRGRMVQRVLEAYRWALPSEDGLEAELEHNDELRRFHEARAHLAARFVPDIERRVDDAGRLLLTDPAQAAARLAERVE